MTLAIASDLPGPQENVTWRLSRYKEPTQTGSSVTPRFKETCHNVRIILEFDTRWQGRIWLNEFSGEKMVVPADGGKPKEWNERDLFDLWAFLQDNYGIDPKKGAVLDAVDIVSSRPGMCRHPLREWLTDCRKIENGFKPDGQHLDGWLVKYLGAKTVFDDEDFSDVINAVGRAWMVGAVRRAFHPGAKMDNTLILKGRQGAYKSTALKTLAGQDGEFFSDSMLDVKSKDAFQNIQGVWIYEFAELDNMKKSTETAIKAFLTSPKDKFRAAYARKAVAVPRQTVFCGTTNESNFLKDTTGNRRMWPIEVGRIDLAGLRNIRAQLWGEAYDAMNRGEQWHLDPEMEKRYEQLKIRYLDAHPWALEVLPWLDAGEYHVRGRLVLVHNRDEITINEILEHCVQKPKDRWTRNDQHVIAGILKMAGWKQRRSKGERCWVRPSPD